ncbi:unnamed protein product [Durusdinium trenchii]|uniref:Uncharacterized protein n=1 Tax=Durusdinium trenchii TaxID=1381693 RepID=A0ABP0S0G5_9DINO
MEVKHIPQFGKQAWGHDLFEKQKELASELWRSSAMGSSPHLTELVRRRPCGQRDSGQRIAPGKLARIQASEITPFFYPEEAAACSITLVTDPATSPTGQIMTIARDGEGALERVFLDNQLPAAGAFLNDVAQARFAKGNKLDIMEPILVVHRDGLRGIAVRPDEARRLVTLGIHPADARAMGNKAVASQQYWAAAEFYCAGLQHAEMDIIATLLSNRCQAAPLYLCQRRCKAAQTAVQEAGCSMLTASEEDMDDVNKQYAARLQEFQDARKEFAKLSAKNDAPSEAALAAVAPYFEAEEEHRGQLAEEQSQEELLRQTVTQAKTRYHGALRSLETLSNQAHLRRASSGVLEPVSRTATEERQERMMKRSPTCQTPERPPKVLRGDSRRRRTGHGPSLPLQKDLGDEELMESEHELPAS